MNTGIARCKKRGNRSIENGINSIGVIVRVSQEWRYHKRKSGEYWIQRNNVEMVIDKPLFDKYFEEVDK